jgi:hypothetical protein
MVGRPKLDLGSRGEEWMSIQNEKIWEYRARWKTLCSVTHYSDMPKGRSEVTIFAEDISVNLQ